MGEPGSDLERLRQQIDAIDLELLRLLNARATLVLDIQGLKRRLGLPAYAAVREQAILRGVCSANPGPLPDEAVEEIFRTVLQHSLGSLARNEPVSGTEDPSPPPSAPGGECAGLQGGA